jgi:quercetin dioxygenase-like cupin family protein
MQIGKDAFARECTARVFSSPGPLCANLLAMLLMLCTVGTAWCANGPKKVVFIGGPKSHGFGEHDFPNGIALLKNFLEESPDAKAAGLVVDAYPNGWPSDPAALENVSTIVIYFDGSEGPLHPLANPDRRAQFERLMKQGVGLVALHQAWTVPADDRTINLDRWLGGTRYGLVDRTFEPVRFKPVAHPIWNGVGEFVLNDEYYLTVHFADSGKITPILSGRTHVQFSYGKPVEIGEPTQQTAGWAFEREGGGRSFAFAGMHYLINLDKSELRTILLNAIFWTAGIEVPKNGVRTEGAADAAATLLKAEQKPLFLNHPVMVAEADRQVIDYPWGSLTWYVSGHLKTSTSMTVGQAVILPGHENPRHFHPNCDEVLHVSRGHILQTVGDETFDMKEGDTINIPAGLLHSARDIGTDSAILSISFSSADRQQIGETP